MLRGFLPTELACLPDKVVQLGQYGTHCRTCPEEGYVVGFINSIGKLLLQPAHRLECRRCCGPDGCGGIRRLHLPDVRGYGFESPQLQTHFRAPTSIVEQGPGVPTWSTNSFVPLMFSTFVKNAFSNPVSYGASSCVGHTGTQAVLAGATVRVASGAGVGVSVGIGATAGIGIPAETDAIVGVSFVGAQHAVGTSTAVHDARKLDAPQCVLPLPLR